MKIKLTIYLLTFALSSIFTLSGLAQTNDTTGTQPPSGDNLDEIAKQLNNPVASLISVPLQNNFDFGGGPANHGFQYRLNVQPVMPFSMTENWNVITRTIMPFVYQNDRIGDTSQTGLSDTTFSAFFSPKKPGPAGAIWGLGPLLYLPTATVATLGAQKWGLGPTGLILWQQHGWTYGGLASHTWSFAGDQNRQNLNSTFLQPFVAYTTKTQTTFGANMEDTYDWENHQWTVPINLMLTQLVKIGKMPVSFQIGGRYYADKPVQGPHWGLRFTVTFVFPK